MDQDKTIKPTIAFDDFLKIDMRVGLITEVEKVPKKDKLYKLTVNFGKLGDKTVVSAIVPLFSEDQLLNKKTLFVLNLEPRIIAGIESQAMIILSDDENNKAYFTASEDSIPGSIA